MLTKENILAYLRKTLPQLKELGVERIGLFGSFAKGAAHTTSDIDIYVEMPANYSNLCKLYNIIENAFNKKVDIVRKGSHVRKEFLESIQQEMIYA